MMPSAPLSCFLIKLTRRLFRRHSEMKRSTVFALRATIPLWFHPKLLLLQLLHLLLLSYVNSVAFLTTLCPNATNSRQLSRKPRRKVHSHRRNRRPGAKSAQEEPSTSVESAGNASLHSFAPSGHPSKSQLDTHTHWNADTGASSTMTPNRHWMHNYTPYCIPIRLADDTIVYSACIGSVLFLPEVEGKKSDKIVEFTRVLHVPQLGTNLLAVLYLTRRCGYQITIDHTTMHFVHQNQVLFTATIGRNNAAFLNGTTLPASEHAQLVSTLPLDYSLWHRRLAHHNLADVQRMIQKDLVTGVKLRSTSAPDPICEPCLAGKMHANPFPSSEHRASKPLELIHSDVHGPVVHTLWILVLGMNTGLQQVEFSCTAPIPANTVPVQGTGPHCTQNIHGS